MTVYVGDIMCFGNRYKVSDFGLAKTVLTGSGSGTPVYSAPEVYTNNQTSVKSDIFSSGMTLFQLCNNYSDLGHWIKSLDPIINGKVISEIGYEAYVPRKIRAICNKACAFDPQDRFESVEAMRQALERLQVLQDWQRDDDIKWHADVNGGFHRLEADQRKSFECVYTVSGRRKNSKCKFVANLDEIKKWQHKIVYDNTF